MAPSDFGQKYWGIFLVNGGQVFAYADSISVVNGAILLLTHEGELKTPTLVFPPGSWKLLFAADAETGDLLSVDADRTERH
jgi:hypothetical protein